MRPDTLRGRTQTHSQTHTHTERDTHNTREHGHNLTHAHIYEHIPSAGPRALPMDDQAGGQEGSAPKKRGRKPLPPDERSKRGRKRESEKVVHEHKTTKITPPLQISFVCGDDAGERRDGDDGSRLVEGGRHMLSPFAELGAWASGPPLPHAAAAVAAAARSSAVAGGGDGKGDSMLLDESDDDETLTARARPRVDMSSLNGEKCIELLGAHTSRKEWPLSTEVACWNCTFAFDAIPIAIPEKLDRATGRLSGCFGVFCSFNCARRHCLQTNGHSGMQKIQLLSDLHRKLLGNFVRIKPAPPFQVLARFGGYMSIDEYRKDFVTLPPSEKMLDPHVRRDKVELLEKHCIPRFSLVYHTHDQQLVTDSLHEREPRREGYDRTRPLPGTQSLATSMSIVRHSPGG